MSEPIKYSEENHTLLVQLSDNLTSVSGTLNSFIKSQGEENQRQREENQRIHGRIDHTNTSIGDAVSSVKDTIAERSRVTPALVATIISSVAILCGGGWALVGVRLDSIRTDVANNQRELHIAEGQRLSAKEKLDSLAIKSYEEDARQGEARRWAEKLQDETRARVEKLFERIQKNP